MKKNYILKYVIYVLIIGLTSTYLILLSYGYRINFPAWKLQKTSVIYLASLPRDVNVYINNKLLSDSTPLRYTYVFPGYYDVKIEKDKYLSWEKSFNVLPDYVSQDADIILILENRKEIELTDAQKADYLKDFQDRESIENTKKGIYIKNGNEIYFNDVFVTRLSKAIKNITWYADKKHLIYQVDDKIYFMDSDGTNAKMLVQLPGDKTAEFISTTDGKYLVYRYDDKIVQLQITDINSIFTEKYFNRAVKIVK